MSLKLGPRTGATEADSNPAADLLAWLLLLLVQLLTLTQAQVDITSARAETVGHNFLPHDVL